MESASGDGSHMAGIQLTAGEFNECVCDHGRKSLKPVSIMVNYRIQYTYSLFLTYSVTEYFGGESGN